MPTLHIYVAATRERASSSENVFHCELRRVLNFAKFVISVPRTHTPGNIEMPIATSDPQSSFAVVDQAVKRRRCPTRRYSAKKHKIFAFVHGSNFNFQELLFRSLPELQTVAVDPEI